jgi:predicted lactoylglutathione lyase
MRFSFYAGLVLLAAALTVTLGSPAQTNMQQSAAKAAAATAPAASPISGQVTFLYCNDLGKASEFYARLLEKKPSLDLDWVKIYPVTETLSVGLVDSTHGALRPAASKPVMLSFVVQNRKQVDEWYARLKALGAQVPHAPESMDLKNGRGIYSLSFKDSEGYSLEIFSWAP